MQKPHSRVPCQCSQGSVILDTPQAAPGYISGAHVKQQQWIIVTIQGLVLSW